MSMAGIGQSFLGINSLPQTIPFEIVEGVRATYASYMFGFVNATVNAGVAECQRYFVPTPDRFASGTVIDFPVSLFGSPTPIPSPAVWSRHSPVVSVGS
jgi:hypothetical protein